MIIEGFNSGGLKTQSNIFVANDGYMYFQGTDHAVWRVNVADSSDRTNFGGRHARGRRGAVRRAVDGPEPRDWAARPIAEPSPREASAAGASVFLDAPGAVDYSNLRVRRPRG